jgi:hypothetical protein
MTGMIPIHALNIARLKGFARVIMYPIQTLPGPSPSSCFRHRAAFPHSDSLVMHHTKDAWFDEMTVCQKDYRIIWENQE